MSKRTFWLMITIAVAAVAFLILVREIPSSPLDKLALTPASTLPSAVLMAPSPDCSGNPTPSQAAGPYYKAGSPERHNIAEGVVGEKLVVIGYVYNKNCEPIPNVWLDFWQADSKGIYDNSGFTLRGHQYTDVSGMYRLETITPATYESRPPHIHVKVRNGNSPILTSQLYFPGVSQNQTDSIFNSALVMVVNESSTGKVGAFNFILNN